MRASGEKHPSEVDMANKRHKAASAFGPEEEDREREEAESRNGPPGSAGARATTTDFQHHQQRGPTGRERPSFNHYSSKPQMYNANLPFHMHGMNMYPPPPPPPPPGGQQQPPQQQGLLQPPPPPPPPQYPYYPQGQYQYNPYWMMPQ